MSVRLSQPVIHPPTRGRWGVLEAVLVVRLKNSAEFHYPIVTALHRPRVGGSTTDKLEMRHSPRRSPPAPCRWKR
jgi:hypothetical protein